MISKIDAATLLAGLDLGSAVAESDTLLEAARVETSVFDDLLADRVDLIPGTKGSGKTALYRIFVDFLPQLMLRNRKIIIAHGVQQRQDTMFLVYKKEFDQLSEADFVDFWCIYVVSLAYEQFLRGDRFKKLLSNCGDEIAAFQRAYRDAGIPDFERRKTLQEILAWTLALLTRLKPKVTWKPKSHQQPQFLRRCRDLNRAAPEWPAPMHEDGIAKLKAAYLEDGHAPSNVAYGFVARRA